MVVQQINVKRNKEKQKEEKVSLTVPLGLKYQG